MTLTYFENNKNKHPNTVCSFLSALTKISLRKEQQALECWVTEAILYLWTHTHIYRHHLNTFTKYCKPQIVPHTESIDFKVFKLPKNFVLLAWSKRTVVTNMYTWKNKIKKKSNIVLIPQFFRTSQHWAPSFPKCVSDLRLLLSIACALLVKQHRLGTTDDPFPSKRLWEDKGLCVQHVSIAGG